MCLLRDDHDVKDELQVMLAHTHFYHLVNCLCVALCMREFSRAAKCPVFGFVACTAHALPQR